VTWPDLPAPVRAAVSYHVGPIFGSVAVPGGRNSDLASVVDTADRRVFLKGVNGDDRRARMLRNEITAGRIAAGLAPEVLFAVSDAGWLVVGFEHLPGRAADLAPGSPDLPFVAGAVNRIGEIMAPELRPLRDRWANASWSWRQLADDAPVVVDAWNVTEVSRVAARVPPLVAGDRLLHTDLHGAQFVLGDGGAVNVIDWGLPGVGAPWVDAGFLVLRLIEAGHPPDDAEAWAQRELAYFRADAMTPFAAYLAGMWTAWAVADPDDVGKRHRSQLARDYLTWRWF
jgi:Phosphotransferase enzyme family